MPAFTIVKSSDIIESVSRTGIKYWRNHIVKDHEGKFYTRSSSWNLNTKTGKTSILKWSDPYYAEPTNEGRANYRDNEAQAYFEFESTVNKQTDKRSSERVLPMLAHKYTDKREMLTFPAYIQRKYNGMRMLTDGRTAWSRGNKDIIPEVVQHLLTDELRHLFSDGSILDGELMLPGNVKLQETMKAVKKYTLELSPKVVYVVYDIIFPEISSRPRDYEYRHAFLRDRLARLNNPQVIFAETLEVETHEEIVSAQKVFTAEGFEGTIIRMREGTYEVNLRSKYLLKLKDFIDEEFQIVDVINSGGGSSHGIGKFVCKATNGLLFEAVSEGDAEYRRDLLVNKHKYVGKYATVRYFELTNDGKPFHGVAVDVREKGDF